MYWSWQLFYALKTALRDAVIDIHNIWRLSKYLVDGETVIKPVFLYSVLKDTFESAFSKYFEYRCIVDPSQNWRTLNPGLQDGHEEDHPG